ncbi:MAG: hypothetical protein M1835_004062, partial [Candelina submexicana]
MEASWGLWNLFSEDSKQDFEAIVDATIKLVVKRRRMLESRARNSLNAQDIKRLRLSSESVIDFNVPLAISMMRGKIDVPASLENFSPSGGTVYHIEGLNLRQADVLWDAGFHDINDLDSMGLSPLMKCRSWQSGSWKRGPVYIAGRSTHFRTKKGEDTGLRFGRIYKSERASSTTALHYLASAYAVTLYWRLNGGKDIEDLLSKNSIVSE